MPGGAVVPPTRRRGRKVKLGTACSGSSISVCRADTAVPAISSMGCSTVVRAGCVHVAASIPSKPTIERSSGTRRPRAVASCMAPIAIRSFEQMIPVGRSPFAPSMMARRVCFPPATVKSACSMCSLGSIPASRSASARPAIFSRVAWANPSPGGEADAAVPELEQVLGREAPRGSLVDADRGDGKRLGAAVHEDEPRTPVEQLPVVRMLAADVGHLGADEEHPLDPALEQHLHVVDLAHRRAGGVAEDRGVAGAGRVRLHRLCERGEDRVRELGHEQPDRTRSLGAAGGHVEELTHGALDPLTGLRAHAGRAADDPRCGGDANSGSLCDVSKAGGPGIRGHRHGISVFTRRKHFPNRCFVSYHRIERGSACLTRCLGNALPSSCFTELKRFSRRRRCVEIPRRN